MFLRFALLPDQRRRLERRISPFSCIKGSPKLLSVKSKTRNPWRKLTRKLSDKLQLSKFWGPCTFPSWFTCRIGIRRFRVPVSHSRNGNKQRQKNEFKRVHESSVL